MQSYLLGSLHYETDFSWEHCEEMIDLIHVDLIVRFKKLFLFFCDTRGTHLLGRVYSSEGEEKREVSIVLSNPHVLGYIFKTEVIKSDHTGPESVPLSQEFIRKVAIESMIEDDELGLGWV